MTKDVMEEYAEYETNRNKKFQENELERGFFDNAKDSFKGFLSSKNAVSMAMIMFYLLLILGEWKVFDASMVLTKNNWELSLSVLLVTGVSAAVAERAHQNSKATKNQKFIASLMWFINLFTAAIFGFLAFILSGKDLKYDIVLLPGFTFNVDGAGTILFGIVSLLTFAEIIAYRAYVDGDIDVAAKRRLASLREKSRKADLDLMEAKQVQATEIKIEHERKLALVEEKLNTIQLLNERYSGKVPENVLRDVMNELTGIKTESILTQSKTIVNEVKQSDEQSRPSKRPYHRRSVDSIESPIPAPSLFTKEEEKKEENFTTGEATSSEEESDGWKVD